MPTQKIPGDGERIDLHKDGSIRAKGQMRDGLLHGYWEWFRKDGSIMRSGNFERGQQSGEWKTFTSEGRLVKTTHFKLPPTAPVKSK